MAGYVRLGMGQQCLLLHDARINECLIRRLMVRMLIFHFASAS